MIQYTLHSKFRIDTSSFASSGVNFTNVLQAAFMLIDPESIKKIDNLTVFFTLLGSARVKAVRRMLMKLSLGKPNHFQTCKKGSSDSKSEIFEVEKMLLELKKLIDE